MFYIFLIRSRLIYRRGAQNFSKCLRVGDDSHHASLGALLTGSLQRRNSKFFQVPRTLYGGRAKNLYRLRLRIFPSPKDICPNMTSPGRRGCTCGFLNIGKELGSFPSPQPIFSPNPEDIELIRDSKVIFNQVTKIYSPQKNK